jgi:Flp pilus assembly protein TadD
MAPDDASLSALVEVWSHKALVSMADAYLKQAEIDERSGRPAESAQAYLRATVGMPRSASTHERAAAMLLASEGDVRKAVEMARRAVELAPNNTTYRLTLAQAYVAAKLFVTARSELEGVLAVEPTHERAKALLRGLPR